MQTPDIHGALTYLPRGLQSCAVLSWSLGAIIAICRRCRRGHRRRGACRLQLRHPHQPARRISGRQAQRHRARLFRATRGMGGDAPANGGSKGWVPCTSLSSAIGCRGRARTPRARHSSSTRAETSHWQRSNGLGMVGVGERFTKSGRSIIQRSLGRSAGGEAPAVGGVMVNRPELPSGVVHWPLNVPLD